MSTYVELQATSHFSFLRGASSPEELFAAAALLGHRALGLADLGTVAGMVRGWQGQKATGVRLLCGSRVVLDDGRGLLLYPTDKAAWSRLTRLLTIGKARAGKGGCDLAWEEVVAHAEGLVAILPPDMPGDTTARDLSQLATAFNDRAHMALTMRRRPDDMARLHALAEQARGAGMRAVATGDVLYHAPEARLLQDVLTCIRERTTIDRLGYRRETLAKFLGFAWRDSDPSGAGSIEWYHRWIQTGDPAVRQRILDYNEDDCRATVVLLDGIRNLS